MHVEVGAGPPRVGGASTEVGPLCQEAAETGGRDSDHRLITHGYGLAGRRPVLDIRYRLEVGGRRRDQRPRPVRRSIAHRKLGDVSQLPGDGEFERVGTATQRGCESAGPGNRAVHGDQLILRCRLVLSRREFDACPGRTPPRPMCVQLDSHTAVVVSVLDGDLFAVGDTLPADGQCGRLRPVEADTDLGEPAPLREECLAGKRRGNIPFRDSGVLRAVGSAPIPRGARIAPIARVTRAARRLRITRITRVIRVSRITRVSRLVPAFRVIRITRIAIVLDRSIGRFVSDRDSVRPIPHTGPHIRYVDREGAHVDGERYHAFTIAVESAPIGCQDGFVLGVDQRAFDRTVPICSPHHRRNRACIVRQIGPVGRDGERDGFDRERGDLAHVAVLALEGDPILRGVRFPGVQNREKARLAGRPQQSSFVYVPVAGRVLIDADFLVEVRGSVFASVREHGDPFAPIRDRCSVARLVDGHAGRFHCERLARNGHSRRNCQTFIRERD